MTLERLTAEYPCCGRQMRLAVHTERSRARWIRVCTRCETTWDVQRVSRVEPIDGMTVSVLELTDTKSSEYVLKYGNETPA